MMASLALRRLAGKGFSTLRPLGCVSMSRSFNTNAHQMARLDHDEPQHRRGAFLSDVLDPFAQTRSVSQLMKLMEELVEKPLSTGQMRRGWDIREDEEALHLKVDMPGLGKDDVKISVEDNTLIIRGEALKESEEEDDFGRRYSTRIDLTPNAYQIDAIKAEMKNGVLKLFVPKLKHEDRKDVFHVQVN